MLDRQTFYVPLQREDLRFLEIESKLKDNLTFSYQSF